MNPIRTIAVDLTAVVPGGANGGAKIFIIELLRELAALVPECRFVLLTQLASHEELALLDRPNVTRRLVRHADAGSVRGSWQGKVADVVLRRFPTSLIETVLYQAGRALRRREAGTILSVIDADLLFCPFTAPTYREVGIPTVCTIYDLQFKTDPQFFAPKDAMFRDHSFRDACRLASVLITISEYSRQSAIKHGGITSEQIIAIPLRMAHRVLHVDLGIAQSVSERLGLAGSRYLLYPANFWKHKNHEMLLTAFAMARATGLPEDVRLVCTGAADARQESLRFATQANGLEERVLFPGFLTNAEFAAVMNGCTAVIFPSLYEGFGLPVIEAMAAGKPVACSNLTSLPEIAGEAALMFDPRTPVELAAGMCRIVGDELLRAELVAAGYIRAQEFADSRRMAMDYWQLFESTVVKCAREDAASRSNV